MALDPAVMTESGAETPATPEVSEPQRGFLASAMQKLRLSRETPSDGAEPTTVEEPASTPTAEPITTPPIADDWRAPASREEHERQVQAEVDRRDYQRTLRDRQAAEQQRQETMSTLEAQLREARRSEGDDSYTVAQLASQIDDLKQGIERDTQDLHGQLELTTNIAMQQAARMHKAGLSPLLEGLPEPEVKELAAWFESHRKPDANGQYPLTPDEMIGQLSKKIVTTRDAHIRTQVQDELLSEIKNDPKLRQIVMAHLYGDGDYGEPEHIVSGTPAGLPTDEQLDRMSPQEYLRLKLSPEDERRILSRARRS